MTALFRSAPFSECLPRAQHSAGLQGKKGRTQDSEVCCEVNATGTWARYG